MIFQSASDKSHDKSASNHAVIENVGFLYDPLGQEVPWTKYKRPGNFDRKNTDNFKITGSGNISFNNIYREFNPGDYERSVISGASCMDRIFNDYSFIASRSSQYESGTWIFEATIPAFRNFDFQLRNETDSFLPFIDVGGIYFYNIVFLYDINRSIGVSPSVTGRAAGFRSKTNFGQGGATVIDVKINTSCMARVYRGTEKDKYDRFVDVPIFGSTTLYDIGITLNERPWLLRAPASVDAFSVVDEGAHISPFNVDPVFAPYGKMICRTSQYQRPAAGQWRAGDTVEFLVPQKMENIVGEQFCFGYARVSNGSDHVIGEDWVELIWNR